MSGDIDHGAVAKPPAAKPTYSDAFILKCSAGRNAETSMSLAFLGVLRKYNIGMDVADAVLGAPKGTTREYLLSGGAATEHIDDTRVWRVGWAAMMLGSSGWTGTKTVPPAVALSALVDRAPPPP